MEITVIHVIWTRNIARVALITEFVMLAGTEMAKEIAGSVQLVIIVRLIQTIIRCTTIVPLDITVQATVALNVPMALFVPVVYWMK